MRVALAGISVAAYRRGISVYGHVDSRLPSRLEGDSAPLAEFLRQGLARTVAARSTREIALCLWSGGPGEATLIIEASRRIDPGVMPATGMMALWTPSASANAFARPVSHRIGDGIEAVLVPLPDTLRPAAPQIGGGWRDAFRGKRLLSVTRIMLSRERWSASLDNLGMTFTDAAGAEAAIAATRAGRDRGMAPDLVVLDSDLLGDEAAEVARFYRDDPDLAGALIVLIGGSGRQVGKAPEEGLYDAILRPPMPWRRLFDTLCDLIRSGEESPAPRPAQISTPPRIPELEGKRILIAEDVETNQTLLRAMLAPTGAQVEIVADGAALIARHSEAPADLVLLDLRMPGMDGLTAIRHIRALPGPPGQVRAVALTAYARAADRRTALAAGMDAYLAKPVLIGEFYALLDQLLT